MASALKFKKVPAGAVEERRRKSGSVDRAPRSVITPELKSWIDNCLVPILVKEYLAGHVVEKTVAAESAPVVTSPAIGMVSEGVQ
jgi:hypothetical protein